MNERVRNLIPKIRSKLSDSLKKKEIQTVVVCAAQVPFFTGGAEIHVNMLVEQLKKRGYETDLINIPFKWYPHKQLLNSIEIWEKLDLRESNGKKIDLVIATKFPSYFVQHQRKVLWLIHQYRQLYDLYETPYSGFDPDKKNDQELHDRLIRKDTRVLKSYQRIFTNSKNTASRLKKYNGIVSTPLYHPPKLVGQYRHGIDKGYILSVGRLESLKRVNFLIETLRFCDKRITCKVAGTGPEEKELRSLAEKMNVSDRVEFLGFVADKDLIDLYAHCSFVFFAPRDEDYGYITLEAFLSKKPVMTCVDSGGPLEFVEDGVSGVVLKRLDPQEASIKIGDLFFDEEKKKLFGRNGYKRVKDINWDDVIASLIPGYKP